MKKINETGGFRPRGFLAFAERSLARKESKPAEPEKEMNIDDLIKGNFDLGDASSCERFMRWLYATTLIIHKMEEKHKERLRGHMYAEGARAMMAELRDIVEIKAVKDGSVSENIKAFAELVSGTGVRESEIGSFNYFLLTMIRDYGEHRLLKQEVGRVLLMYVNHNPDALSVTAVRVQQMAADNACGMREAVAGNSRQRARA
ncbi:MAG: hypothetical protein LBO78_00470 [Rickettsiales bacterium]|jgi:hypothetical protein|nr:hypothetical protein [Rickettsiales bacterium]